MLIFSRRFRSCSSKRPLASGFTLIELLAVVGIMAILTTTMMLRQSQFNSSTLLRSLAYSVALSIRQAQTYGISVQNVNGNFTAPAYGIHVQGPTAAGACPQITSYLLFADQPIAGFPNGNGFYDANDAAVRTFNLNKGYYISNVAAQKKGTTQYDCMCASPAIKLGGGTTATCATSGYGSMDIMFRRPNPDACFTIADFTGVSHVNGVCDGSAAQSNYPLGVMQVTAQGGSTRGIRINTTGEIEVISGS